MLIYRKVLVVAVLALRIEQGSLKSSPCALLSGGGGAAGAFAQAFFVLAYCRGVEIAATHTQGSKSLQHLY